MEGSWVASSSPSVNGARPAPLPPARGFLHSVVSVQLSLSLSSCHQFATLLYTLPVFSAALYTDSQAFSR